MKKVIVNADIMAMYKTLNSILTTMQGHLQPVEMRTQL